MQNKENLWYRMGYALEKTKNRLPAAKGDGGKKPSPVDDVSHKVLDALLTVGAGSVLTRALSLWPSRKGPGLFRLFRAGAAGAAAAFLAELARPVLTGKKTETALEEELTDILLAGAGRGLLYAALVEPRIPAPPILQGAAYGSLEYALRPWGGLGELAGSKAPHGKIPALQVLLKDRGADEHLVEHVAFGVALALLYDR
jgi:hypothetical protein